MKFFLTPFRFVKRSPVVFVLFLLFVISVTVLHRYRWREDNWKRSVQGDGCGYYGYLPAVFLYQDMQYRFYLDLEKKYGFGDLSGNFLCTDKESGKFYNRYFCGTSLALTPFFLLAWLASVLFGFDADGHSMLFNYALNLGGVIYALTGLYFLSKFLLRHFSKWVVAAVCGAIYLGTNLFTYALYESSYSHVYSFAYISIFIYLADKSVRNKTRASYIWLAACLAMIVLIRPTNGIVLISVPFIAGSKQAFLEWLRAGFNLKTIIPAALCGVVGVGIQSALYYAQCGSWWVDGYQQETFYFTQPEIVNMWCSYRAGVLLWSPVTLLMIPGIFFMFRKNAFMTLKYLGFLFVNSWIISSWWAWHYEGTFGMRPMVDHMAYLTIPICFTLHSLQPILLRSLGYLVLTALMLIGQVFNFQKTKEILPYDKMNKAKYWYIFLKTDSRYIYDLAMPYHPAVPNPLQRIVIHHYDFKEIDPSDPLPKVNPKFNSEKTIDYPGTGDMEFVRFPLASFNHPERYYVDVHLKVKYASLYTLGELRLTFLKKGEVIVNETMPVISPDFSVDTWNTIRLSTTTHVPMQEADEMVISFHNGERRKVQLQQLEFNLATY